jgi:hypothetical protein
LEVWEELQLLPFSQKTEFNTLSAAATECCVGAQSIANLWLVHFLVKTSLSDASTGTSRDHTHGKFNIPISFTVEMRGNGPYGNFGFFLPSQFILPNAEEVLKGITALIHTARDEFGRFAVNAM